MVGTYDKLKVSKLYSHCMPIQFMHTCLIISLHGVVVFFGDYRIRRQIYYSHCMPIQFMHTCLIISLHGVVVFFGDYRVRRQIYVHM